MKDLANDCKLIDLYMMGQSKNRVEIKSIQSGKTEAFKEAMMKVIKVRMFLDKGYKNE
jgi:hypothetical protein